MWFVVGELMQIRCGQPVLLSTYCRRQDSAAAKNGEDTADDAQNALVTELKKRRRVSS